MTSVHSGSYQAGDTATIVGWLKDCPTKVLDVNADPRALESLARLLEKLKG